MQFYEAFARRDAAAMRACYHPEVEFSDEVFELRGAYAGAMWTMLCAQGEDLRLTYSYVEAGPETGSARWVAEYTFGPTGRSVLNTIEARFTFADGLIRTHRDSFDFWRWTRQALGAPGLLLGWTPWLRAKVVAQASKNLERFIARHPEALEA
jgi:hypothetical protein